MGGVKMQKFYEVAYKAVPKGPLIRRRYSEYRDAWKAYEDNSLYRCTLYKLENGERHVISMKIRRGWE